MDGYFESWKFNNQVYLQPATEMAIEMSGPSAEVSLA